MVMENRWVSRIKVDLTEVRPNGSFQPVMLDIWELTVGNRGIRDCYSIYWFLITNETIVMPD